MLIQNRNDHVNASVWPYRSDPNEISFGFEGLVYTDRIGLHWPCKRTGIRLVYMSSFAHVISSVSYGQDRKSQFPLDTQSDLKINRNVLLSLSANQIRLSPSVSLFLSRARTHTLASNSSCADSKELSAYCRIVFTTNREQYTPHAFEYEALELERQAVIRMRV